MHLLFAYYIVDPKSIILFECKRRWEALGFSFDLNWTLPCYVGNAINQFVVELKLTDGTENVSIPIDNHTFILQDNEVIYNNNKNLTYIKLS